LLIKIQSFKNNKYNFLIKSLLIISLYFFFYKFLFNDYQFFINHKNYLIPNKFRIAFVFGTKHEAIKLFPLIIELKKKEKFLCITINTGQPREMLQQVFESLKMGDSIDFNLNLMKKNESLAKLTSKIISTLDDIFNLISPNAIVIQGETTTAFSAAVSAFYQKIPIFHIEAGLRTHNIYYPFPKEFDSVTIDDLSTLYFAPNKWAAINLLKENKNSTNVFITGNPIVDSLQLTLNNTTPSEKMLNLIQKAKSFCISDCKIILLTCQGSENYYKPLINILKAIQQLLNNYKDIVIIFSLNFNPNFRQTIKNAFPHIIYNNIINGKKIKDPKYFHLNRFLIIPPLNYVDLVHLESVSYFIISDSGGIQEQAVSIGKPILLLRENSERPKSNSSESAFLTGITYNKIYNYSSSLLLNNDLYKKVCSPKFLFGKGNSRFIISKIIENYFKNNLKNSVSFDLKKYQDILNQFDKSIIKNKNTFLAGHRNYEDKYYDIVIVLTVWKRNNLERQLIQVKNQSILKNKRINIIIFQNSNHVYINDILNNWKKSNSFPNNVEITFIQSPIETGYFGRFIIPLTSSVRSDSYFFICDDDVVWGKRFFENMMRVVNEGYLCTRNGRIITQNYYSTTTVLKTGKYYQQSCYNEDIKYDFGGHIWAGRISWLRKAWNHIPLTFENCEDFWISAVLKSFYNISTKIPKCPCPEKRNTIPPDLCAASDNTSRKHNNAHVGNSIIFHKNRKKIFEKIVKGFNYQPLNLTKPDYVKNIYKKYIYGDNIFDLSDALWKDALVWID